MKQFADLCDGTFGHVSRKKHRVGLTTRATAVQSTPFRERLQNCEVHKLNCEDARTEDLHTSHNSMDHIDCVFSYKRGS